MAKVFLSSLMLFPEPLRETFSRGDGGRGLQPGEAGARRAEMNGRWVPGAAALPYCGARPRSSLPLLLNGLGASRRDEKSKSAGEERQSANPPPLRGIGDIFH